jgi:DNA-binding SARP family transcriptional activator
LIVTEDGSFFRLRGETNDLSRRTAPRRLLKYLADAHARSPGVPLGRDALIEAGWPGERMRPDAADKRLRTAIWTLRKAGLEGIVVTRDEGYLLHPLARVTRVTAL